MQIEARQTWIEEASESTIGIFQVPAGTASELLAALGSVDRQANLDYQCALRLQGEFYEDGTFDQRAVVQVERLAGATGPRWVTVEPNGFQADLRLLRVAGGCEAASFYWNVNAVMRVKRAGGGKVIVDFDPIADQAGAPPEAVHLPFERAPSTSSLALLEHWMGVQIEQRWFSAAKPTFVVTLDVK